MFVSQGVLVHRKWTICAVFTWGSVPLRRVKPAPGESAGSDVTTGRYVINVPNVQVIRSCKSRENKQDSGFQKTGTPSLPPPPVESK